MKRTPQSILLLLLTCTISWTPLGIQPAVAEVGDSNPIMKQRLAETLARYANEVLISSEVNVPGLNVALSLLQESIRLDPNHPETYRKLITLAILIDREDLLNEATQGLLKIAPDDTRAQLNRLEVAIDGFNTAQDQMNALEQLMKPEVAQ